MLKTYITFIFLSFTAIFFAQNVEFKSSNFKDKKEELKKAEVAIEKGDEFFKLANEAFFNVQSPGLNYQKALLNYSIADKLNSNNGLLNFKMGVCYANSTDPNKSINYIKKAKTLDPTCDPFLDYYFGFVMQLEKKFDDALTAYLAFEANYKKADNFAKFLIQRKNECKYGKTATTSNLRVWIDNVSELNSEFDDYAPSISTDGSEIIFTSNRPNSHTPNEVGGFDKDIFSSSLNGNKWSDPKDLSGTINTPADEVSNNLSYNATSLLLHREVNGQTDIFESKLKGLEWSDPTVMNVAISSTKSNERYASYSSDGWSLFFTRDSDTKENGYEILNSAMQNKMLKDFMTPIQLTAVSSKFDDGPIYIHIDGETMYLASEGNESIGGYDIFISKRAQGQWSKPVNMGYPINTPYDDFFFASTANGKFAYISSNREGGKGGYDIYKVTFWGPEKKPVIDVEDYLLASVIMPMKDHQIEAAVDVNKKSFTVFKGVSIDAMTKKPVEADIEITDNVTGKVIETFTTNSATGKFIITLVSGKNYGIAVKAKGYLFHSENFDIPTGSADNLVNTTIELKNIAVGSKIALRNIFFDLGKATLRAESNAELDRLVKLMKDVPTLKVEISGHTDNSGSATLNQTLSQQRADAVVTYIVNKGIPAARLTAKGYGSTKPIASNSSDDGKQQNRRTEFEIKAN